MALVHVRPDQVTQVWSECQWLAASQSVKAIYKNRKSFIDQFIINTMPGTSALPPSEVSAQLSVNYSGLSVHALG